MIEKSSLGAVDRCLPTYCTLLRPAEKKADKSGCSLTVGVGRGEIIIVLTPGAQLWRPAANESDAITVLSWFPTTGDTRSP